jgi:predicted extracellular nuclease
MKNALLKKYRLISSLMLVGILALVAAVGPRTVSAVAGAVNITSLGTPFTQNFDTLPASGSTTWVNDSTIPGWYHARTGTGTTIVANDGGSNAGNLYSYGTGTNTDRALGSLGSGNAAIGNLFWGVRLSNQTGSTITSLTVSYTGEQWRNSAAAAQTIAFSYLIGTNLGGSLADFQAAGVNVTQLDFTSPITGGAAVALNGNLAANRTAISFTINGLSLANNAEILLRWSDPDHTGADHGLSIDDFSVTANGGGGPTNPSGVGAANPSTVVQGGTTLLTVTVTPGTNPTSTGLMVTGDLTSIGGSATQQFFDDGVTGGDMNAGDNIFSFNATVAMATTPGMKSLPFTITDAQARMGSGSISLTVTGGAGSTRIHDIQGAAHISPMVGMAVSGVPGIVTGLISNGFYLQDPTPDANNATSEGIFVFTSSAPTVSVGQSILVSGNVTEFRAGGASSTNLTITEIGSPTIAVVSSGNPLPPPVVIGTGGRMPPTMVIEDDASGSVETTGVFDPDSDGIDFYESLEGMRVQVNDAVATSPTKVFGTSVQNREISVIGDNGANASVRTTRGGIVVRANDFNPERIILNDLITGGPILPSINVGASFPGATVGVMDYNFGNFKLEVTSVPAASGSLMQEVTTAPGTNQVAIATFNCQNLDPNDGPAKFNTLADQIVNHLLSPDLITLEEIQDNNGATDNGVVDPSTTMSTLISAIQSAGGPLYQYRQIDPVNDQDGGEPGGNIRQVFMFRTDRGLSFIDRPGGTSTTATTVQPGPQLSFSPGRIDPTNSAWNSSRKPLAGEFLYNGHKIFVIGNHFNSKGGDEPLYGRNQPPTLSSEVQRVQQAQIVHDFVNMILTQDANASVVVLGDLNDYEFSNPLTILKGTMPVILHAMVETLPQSERYSYVFDGNSQTLDHILITDNPFNNMPAFDIVHLNSEFAVQASDHDPSVLRLTFAPTAAALDDFSATAQGSEVLLRWQTGEEVDNLGFNIYREVSGTRTRITPQIVAGSALIAGPGTTLTAGRSYSWWDALAQGKQDVRYWLETIDLKGNSLMHGPVTIKSASGGKRSAAKERQAVMLNMLGREQTQESPTRPVEATADAVQLAAAQLQSDVNLAGQPAVKISVSHEGWYRVTQPELVRAGLDPKVNPRLLQLYVDGREQPIFITGKNGQDLGPADAIEFYGIGVDTASTNSRVYWLIAGSQPGQRIQQVKATGGLASAASFAYTAQRKDRTIYFSALRNGDKENFFGAVVTRTPINQSLMLQHVAVQAAASATLEVALQGVTASAHQVKILLNGSPIGVATFEGQNSYVAKLPIPQALLREGENVVNLAAQASEADTSLVDYYQLTYQHSFTADNNALRLTAAGKQQVTIDGFTASTVRVFDVTDANAAQEIIGVVKPQKNGYGVTVTVPGNGSRTLLAITSDQAQRSSSVTANQPSNWRQPNQAADLVIITHRSLLASARQLQTYRESRGLRVALVDVEDLFDEFSFGTKSAYAMRDFLAYAKASWQRAPQFVLLMGDASLDPKNYLGHGDFDLVPTKLIDTQYLETSSDDWLTDFTGKGLAEMAVGRLPVRGADEATRMITKIINYERAQIADGALIVNDSSDSFNFANASDQLRGLIPPDIKVEQIDRGQLGTPAAKKALLDAIQRGQKIVNYLGHGAPDLWRGSLLTSAEARGLTNGDHLPLFVAMTCLNGYFQDVSLDSLAESLMKAENGGAIAVWTSSGMTLPGGQSLMNQQLYKLLFDASNGHGRSLGEVTLRAKSTISDPDIRRTWILFGDPTTQLK